MLLNIAIPSKNINPACITTAGVCASELLSSSEKPNYSLLSRDYLKAELSGGTQIPKLFTNVLEIVVVHIK